MDLPGAQRISQTGRALTRGAFALFYILLPLVNDISDLHFLATYAGVSAALVVLEMWAKLGSDFEDTVDHRAVDAEQDRHDAEDEQKDKEAVSVPVTT